MPFAARIASCILFGLLLMMQAGCASSQASLARFEDSQVFQPAPYPAGDWNPAGLAFEDAWFQADDGTKLHGWYCPHEDPVAVVLVAHGNAGNVSIFAETLKILNERHRLAALVFDYRGYGRSEGTPSEEGILQDARAARRWLAARAKVAERDIVLMGQSLGGGVMVDLAARDGARGLVLASTFTSLPDVARHHLPLVPANSLMTNRLESLAKIGDYHGPLLQVHGDRDRVIPFAQGKKLFEAANEPKRFVINPGGDHNDPLSEEYRQALDEFLANLMPSAS